MSDQIGSFFFMDSALGVTPELAQLCNISPDAARTVLRERVYQWPSRTWIFWIWLTSERWLEGQKTPKFIWCQWSENSARDL